MAGTGKERRFNPGNEAERESEPEGKILEAPGLTFLYLCDQEQNESVRELAAFGTTDHTTPCTTTATVTHRDSKSDTRTLTNTHTLVGDDGCNG